MEFMSTTTIDEVKNVVFTNLLLLGFDCNFEENAHGIKFDSDVFDTVNKTSSEVVLYFLFSRLNYDLAKEEFKSCYPVIDKIQEQCFRKVCGNWILSIAKENRDFDFPSAVSSILMKKGGKKFIHLLFSLSRYVLYEVAKNELDNSYVSLLIPPSQFQKVGVIDEAKRKVLQALIDEHMNNFLDSLQFVIYHVNEDKLEGLFTKYYEIKKKIKQSELVLEAALQELDLTRLSQVQILLGQYCEEWNKLMHSTKLKEQKVAFDWEAIESLLAREKELWESCAEVVFSKKQPLVLEGKEIKAMLPNSPDSNNQLCLTKLSESWVVTLEFIMSQMGQMKLPTINPVPIELSARQMTEAQNIDLFRLNLKDALLRIREEFYNCCNGNSSAKEYGSPGLYLPSPPFNFNPSTIKQHRIIPLVSRICSKSTRNAQFKSGPRRKRLSSKNVPSEKEANKDLTLLQHSLSEQFDGEVNPILFNLDKEFGLDVLESPLRLSGVNKFETTPITTSTPSPPSRLLNLLRKSKNEDENDGIQIKTISGNISCESGSILQNFEDITSSSNSSGFLTFLTNSSIPSGDGFYEHLIVPGVSPTSKIIPDYSSATPQSFDVFDDGNPVHIRNPP